MAKKRKKIKAVSQKASGLAVARKGEDFTFTWKIPAGGYRVQSIRYRAGSGGWTTKAINNKATSFSVTFPRSSFHPNSGKPAIASVGFAINGTRANYNGTKVIKKKKTPVKYIMSASDWTNEKQFGISVPATPKVSATTGTWPSTTFGWSVAVADDNGPWFTRVQYDSILLRDSNITNGADIKNWGITTWGQKYSSTNNGNASGSLAVTEDTSRLNDGHSYTRWFRVRAQGPRGTTAWAYQKHVYAMPLAPSITNHEFATNKAANGYTVKVWFNNPYSASRPISTIETQYVTATPLANMVCPSGVSWETATSALVKDKTGGSVFNVDGLVDLDECLYARVNTIYDGKTTYGNPRLIVAGKLSQPENLSVSAATGITVKATNKSNVPDSFLVVRHFTTANPGGGDIGIIPHGSTEVIINPAPSGGSYGVYAAVGSYKTATRADGVTVYTVTTKMKSDTVRSGGAIPAAPTGVTVTPTDISGTVRMTWNWSWSGASRAELSWANHPDAWESTDEPETYTITKAHASAWNISGLTTGIKWYFRVRLIAVNESETTYGAYSDTVEIDLASAPTAPVLTLSEGVITEDGQITAAWSYSTTDGTSQAFAEIALVTVENSELVYDKIAEVQTAQYITMNAQDFGWAAGESYTLAVRVVSASGRMSDSWSDGVSFAVAEPITCTISQTNLETVTLTSEDEEGQPFTYEALGLTQMPLNITVLGAGDTGTTMIAVERYMAYHVDRPDETDYNGFEGETVAASTFIGEAPVSFELEDLIGHLDDGAWYKIVATVNDDLGQSATAETVFIVKWEHQAIKPTATAVIDEEWMIAKLTPIAPAGALATDVCDIYRLSVDKPTLIYRGATFGETYVDPYPTIGEYGGHRFVLRTANGDYITEDNEFAWYDTQVDENDYLETPYNLIDFDEGQAQLLYNVDISNQWAKDFQETQYLGGSVQGDWNKAVSRTGSISAVAVFDDDNEDLIETMRRLAAYPGVCHVRTKDGSSYPADVQVSENYVYAQGVRRSEFSLSITKVDQEVLDGMTLQEWEDLKPIEEPEE